MVVCEEKKRVEEREMEVKREKLNFLYYLLV